jgi:archaellum component FlaD/FlaE
MDWSYEMALRTGYAAAMAAGFIIALSGQASAQSSGAPPMPGAQQVESEFNNLSPAAQAEVLKKLRTTDPNAVSNMTPEQAKEAFRSLSPELQSKIRSQIASLSDEQKAALKKMGKEGIKQMIMEKVKEFMSSTAGIRAVLHQWKDKMTGKSDSSTSP